MKGADDAGWTRWPWATAAAALLALALFFWPALGEKLWFERAAILRGEWWRIGTGHWIHYGPSHLLWNLAVLVPAGVWAERLSPLRLRLLLALAPWAIGGALLAFDPALAVYAGLSGLAAAVLLFLALTQLGLRHGDARFWRTVIVLLALKIGFELLADDPFLARFAASDVRPVPLAHIAGAACAGVAFFVHRRG
jgi:rhomboid family GlyGly-CTERM serine protease